MPSCASNRGIQFDRFRRRGSGPDAVDGWRDGGYQVPHATQLLHQRLPSRSGGQTSPAVPLRRANTSALGKVARAASSAHAPRSAGCREKSRSSPRSSPSGRTMASSSSASNLTSRRTSRWPRCSSARPTPPAGCRESSPAMATGLTARTPSWASAPAPSTGRSRRHSDGLWPEAGAGRLRRHRHRLARLRRTRRPPQAALERCQPRRRPGSVQPALPAPPSLA